MAAPIPIPSQRALATAIKEWEKMPEGEFPLTASFRILRNFTTEPLEPFLKYHCYRRGIRPLVSHGDYDAIEAEIFGGVQIEAASARVMVTAMCLDYFTRSRAGDEAFTHLRDLWARALEANPGALLSINTFLPKWNAVSHPGVELDELNTAIRRHAGAGSDCLLADFAGIAAIMGHEQALNPRFWYLYKSPFSERFLNEWADRLAEGVAQRLGRAKKLLVLDCDNTLWGGILGEAGFDGIELDGDAAAGKPWQDFQRQILELQSRGVLLALCSKNNEADVLEVLDRHSAMLIRREHLACWRVDWRPKWENIVQIASELNLGLDAIVFIDDSPHECELVRQTLPDVDVLQTPAPAHLLTGLLRNYRGFSESPATGEDLRRTELYREEWRRGQAKKQFADFDDYLRSLELCVEVRPPVGAELARFAQLTQRTNQFNLTTRRHTEGDISALASSPDNLALILSVKDKFGEYGLAGAAIVRLQAPDLAGITDFLLSCRVLGRRVEQAFIAGVTALAFEKWPLARLEAAYLPSAKNQQTREFFDAAGFELLAEEADGTRRYRIANPVDKGAFIGTITSA